MVKQRLSSADIAAEVACLRETIVGLRIANVYDINPKTYVLKLSRSGEEGEKVYLLIESGARIHTIEGIPPKSETPSNFTLKLRKHLRTRRVEAVRQLGVDRVAQITVGHGDAAHHLILEFFAQGNVVLTDAQYNILTLLRSHRDDAAGLAIMAAHPYPISAIRARRGGTLPREALLQELERAAGENDKEGTEGKDEIGETVTAPGRGTLAEALGRALPYGPAVAEHVARTAGLDPKADAASCVGSADALSSAVAEWEAWLAGTDEHAPKGYILCKTNDRQEDSEQNNNSNGSSALFDLVEPLLLAQHSHYKTVLEFPTFDAALREFFGRIGGQRAKQAQAAKEKAARGKVENAERDAAARVATLQAEVLSNERTAQLIESNLTVVDAALGAVNDALTGGMSWAALERLIKEESAAGNPVAAVIDSMQLDRGRITVLLPELDETSDDERSTHSNRNRRKLRVTLQLDLSAHANARQYYDARRKHQAKKERTLAANDKAIKAAERKAAGQIKQLQAVHAPVIVRKPYWFERFHWFISSENYLVLSGRDAQQNELIVKRYMRKGDIYCHADLHGASSCIVKNHTPDKPVPPLTLSQAGAACVCRSAAWNSKIVTSAWWVYPEQVSKTAPTGEYLTTGSFMIRGKKNYLPPQPLIVGFGLLFRVDDSCIARHLGERAPRLVEEDTAEPEGPGQSSNTERESPGSVSESDEESQQQPDDDASSNAQRSSALEAFLDSGLETLDLGATRAPDQSASVQGQFARYGLAQSVAREGDGLGAVRPLAQSEGKKEQPRSSTGSRPQAAKASQDSRTSKKQKKKGLEKKFADSDDEDRQLTQLALQSAGPAVSRRERKERHKAKLRAKREAQNTAVVQPVTQEDIQRVTQAQFDDEEDSVESDAEEEEVAAGETSDVDAEEAAEIKNLLEEENIQLLDEEDQARLTQVDALTGDPHPDDIILFALPVCAPYQVFTGYKYKVKMVPGAQKKGKAVRQAMELFSKLPGAVQREKEVARAIPESESVLSLVGTVKIQAAGATKLKQSSKQKKKPSPS